jgi:hypothetical protein
MKILCCSQDATCYLSVILPLLFSLSSFLSLKIFHRQRQDVFLSILIYASRKRKMKQNLQLTHYFPIYKVYIYMYIYIYIFIYIYIYIYKTSYPFFWNWFYLYKVVIPGWLHFIKQSLPSCASFASQQLLEVSITSQHVDICYVSLRIKS